MNMQNQLEFDFTGNYYKDLQDTTHPTVFEAIVERLNIYFAETLYKRLYDYDPQKALDRILLSDVDAGSNIAIGDAMEFFRSMNNVYPFTIYTIGDADATWKNYNNQHAALGRIFFPEIQGRIHSWPTQRTLQYASFYNTALDYNTALTILEHDSATMTRLYTIVTMNGVEIVIPFDVLFEIQRGTLNSQFEEYFRTNRVWDLIHTVTVKFHNFYSEDVTVGIVKHLIVRLGKLDDDGKPRVGIWGQAEVPDGPTISASSIADQAIDVPLASTLTLTFSESMQFLTVTPKFSPMMGFSQQWNAAGTILTITFTDPLPAKTKIVMTIPKTASSADELRMEEDFVLTFFTAIA